MTLTGTGQLIIYVSDDPIDDAAIASVSETIGDTEKDAGKPVVCVWNLLEPLYNRSMCTREAAQRLGQAKSILKVLAANGLQIVVLCQRHSENLGTRSHFMASLCASADRVHFRRST
jgi:hypothetical protein